MLDLAQKPFEKFTAHAKSVLAKAFGFARAAQSPTVEPLHLLQALQSEKGSLAYNILKVNEVAVKKQSNQSENIHLDVQRPSGAKTSGSELVGIAFDAVAKNIIKKAAGIAVSYGYAYIGTEHILFSIINNSPLLKEEKKYARIVNQLKQVFASTVHFQEAQKIPHHMFSNGAHERKGRATAKTNGAKTDHRDLMERLFPALSFFCENITRKVMENPVPFLGREKELNRIVSTLLRKSKNNPLLLGEAGVGKTATVHALASKIARKETHHALHGKKIFSLNMGLLVAGTVFRGEFEARLQDILEEAKHQDIILFIDEIHTIVGAGSASGSLDLANMLKPVLAQGAIRLIAATTPDEYRKTIEKDAALARRFQPIFLPEESEEHIFSIINNAKTAYEKHHNILIAEEAVKEAITLSCKYFPGRKLPDKALDMLDEAASRLRSTQGLSAREKEIARMKENLREIRDKKYAFVEKARYEEALALKDTEELLAEHLAVLYKTPASEPSVMQILNARHIQETLSAMLGKTTFDDRAHIPNVASLLKEKIIGQEEAAEKIAQVVARAQAGLLSKNRPMASFLFLGPSGVGKTQTAKEIARIVFGEAGNGYHQKFSSFIRMDMSEFSEPHSVSRLLGSPPGYVGFEEGGFLTEKVKNNPYALVLFDEIEKAHPQIFNILLQILDEGVLTSADGENISFKNTIVILTSNIGSEEFNKHAIGFFGKEKEEAMEKFNAVKKNVASSLKEIMRPELLNRMDHIVTFMPLSADALERITHIQLTALAQRLADEKRITLAWDKKITDCIAGKSHSASEGARLVARTIAELVEFPLAELIIQEKLSGGDTAEIIFNGAAIAIRPVA